MNRSAKNIELWYLLTINDLSLFISINIKTYIQANL